MDHNLLAPSGLDATLPMPLNKAGTAALIAFFVSSELAPTAPANCPRVSPESNCFSICSTRFITISYLTHVIDENHSPANWTRRQVEQKRLKNCASGRHTCRNLPGPQRAGMESAVVLRQNNSPEVLE